MGRFLLRRIAQGIVVVFGVTVIVFVVTRMVGDPVKFILPLEATPEERDQLEHTLGFDRPITTQFGDYIGDLARLDFQESLWQPGRPTMEIVRDALPRTFQLVGAGMLLALLLAIPLGVIAALRPGRALDRLTVTSSLLGLSVPQFWLGLMLIVVFAVQLDWLPPGGSGGWRYVVLPAVTLALPAAGRLTMMVRSSMIDELNRQYVKTAKAKGLPFQRVVAVHALRNASIPVITLTGWEVIRALAGYSVIVETVFGYPGLGKTAIDAIQHQDLYLLQTIVLVVAVMVVVINVLVDLLYTAADPRIKVG
jgi:peptide/nickel transport system permease protein